MTHTRIEWTDMVWNPVTGCSPVSESCRNCYARRMAQRLRGRHGYPEDNPFRVILHPERLEEPLKLKKSRRIFICSMSDLFHEDVPEVFIDRVLEVIAACPQHTFIVLTKRARNLERKLYGVTTGNPCRELGGGDYLPNLWLGVSVENQATADERIPILLQTPAAVRFVSCEPLLGPVSLKKWAWKVVPWANAGGPNECKHGYAAGIPCPQCTPRLDWVICGGETGPSARPMHPDWVRSLRDQCQAAAVPFFFKSWGEWLPNEEEYGCDNPGANYDVKHVLVDINGCICKQSDITPGTVVMAKMGKRAAGRLLDGRTWDEFPMEGGEQE